MDADFSDNEAFALLGPSVNSLDANGVLPVAPPCNGQVLDGYTLLGPDFALLVSATQDASNPFHALQSGMLVAVGSSAAVQLPDSSNESESRL